ncbi:ABC-type transport auxiliary lipoprotein family protein [Methyloceanibacter sp.]|uniref:ABC-type transport auxiliary lipoprotein family protein n=1 Tax=Methyloceanibacter sp. TaxID=1965321 RepID=UPI002D5B562D|nr:ABC-type transport auxiliary lipoprotein family protein [Methyloceanibacter sp.]HZP08060.1 ABC-type transport auxiliary lipoprotein family protein [Methyloceanibacter sp.]
MSRSAPTLAAGMLCLALAGCALAAGSRPPATFDLVAPRSFAATPRPASWQLVVYEPTAIHALETDRLMVRPTADQVSYYKGVAWSDRLPRLVQARIIETFQNSGAVKSVSATNGQYALATDLRAFQIDVSSGKAVAEIEIFAKLVNLSTGRVIATKSFSARVPAATDSPGDAIAALNQGFTEVLQDTTTWVSSRKA